MVKVLRATLAGGSGPGGTVLGENVIACGSGAIRLLEVQPAGKAAMSAADFARGKGLPTGSKVG